MGWIKSLRLPVSLMSGMLVIVSFKLTAWTGMAYYIAAFSSLGTMATMATNDWFDRYHDVKKGKTFAQEKGNRFLLFVIVLWCLVGMMSVGVMLTNLYTGVMALVLTLLGVFYSFSRTIPLLPTVYVAGTSGSVAMFPNLMFKTNYPQTWLLIVITFTVIFGREILKDLQDFTFDSGYKKTIPQLIGQDASRVVAGVAFAASALAACAVSSRTLIVFPLLFVGICLLGFRYVSYAKETVSLAMGILLILLII